MTGPGSRATPTWLFLFLALATASPFAMMHSRSGTRSTEDVPRAEAPEPKPPPQPSVDEHCLARFAQAVREAFPLGPAEPPTTMQQLRDGLAASLPTEPFVAIATVPDPIDTGFSYLFQSHLQAIRLGVEAQLEREGGSQRYFRSSMWLPWYDAEEAHRESSEACRHGIPGLIVFRGSEGDQVALVLLVGETPTAGVYPQAMAAALRIADAISRPTDAAACVMSPAGEIRRLRILAPTFSGSVDSLKTSLSTSWTEDEWEVSIVSGTATGRDLRGKLTDVDSQWFPHGRTEFWTTTVPEDVLQCRYLAFLCYWLKTTAEVGARREDCRDFHGARRLPRVALLHESGTQFGAQNRSSECPFEPGVLATFPANVSALRDAYESMDERRGTRQSIARRTSLEVSLRESRALPGVDGEPSAKIVFARDVALSRTIAALERQRVRHVAVQATDIADAIFISRKVRDVAPDIRIAIFQADNLLLHPSFRQALKGSLVVTPYPFLGASDLDFETTSRRHLSTYEAFDNSGAQGTFNAALALRGARPNELREYALWNDALSEPRYSLLPVWVTAVGTDRFVPLLVAPSTFRHDTKQLVANPIYPGLDVQPRLDDRISACTWEGHAGTFLDDDTRFHSLPAVFVHGEEAPPWKAPFIKLHERRGGTPWRAPSEGPLSTRKPSLPWGVLTLFACVFFVIDLARQHSQWITLSHLRLPRLVTKSRERAVDLAAVRLKWNLYATIRTGIGVLTIAYLLCWAAALGPIPRDIEWLYLGVGGAGLAYVAVWWWRFFHLFSRDFVAFWRAHSEEWTKGTPDTRLVPRFIRYFGLDGWLRDYGLLDSERPLSLARVSQYQALRLAVFSGAIAALLLGVQVDAIGESNDAVSRVPSGWAQILMTERTLTLVGGVSVATPMLLCAAVFYLWTVSRMARLSLLHGISRMTPPDRVADFVSTPIRMILYPFANGAKKAEDDNAFTLAERSSVNAIARPMTGPYYFVGFLGVVFLPLILFSSTAPQTLERDMELPLLAMLYLAYLIIASSLLQLFQYWTSLELLLKSVYQHPLGRAFERVAEFVREPLDEQVSRTPNDLLRLAACVGELEKVQHCAHRDGTDIVLGQVEELDEHATKLRSLRAAALESLGPHKAILRARREAMLGRGLIKAACFLVRLMQTDGVGRKKAKVEGRTPPPPDPGDVGWKKEAQAFAATLVAILINRHVRQLQYFVYPLLVSVILFMCACLSYPFEPHRLIMSFVWSLVLVSVFAGVWTYLQLDRNSLLSNIASTSAGRITPNAGLAYRLLVWGVTPIVAAIAADYPDLVNSIVHWIGPVQIWQ